MVSSYKTDKTLDISQHVNYSDSSMTGNWLSYHMVFWAFLGRNGFSQNLILKVKQIIWESLKYKFALSLNVANVLQRKTPIKKNKSEVKRCLINHGRGLTDDLWSGLSSLYVSDVMCNRQCPFIGPQQGERSFVFRQRDIQFYILRWIFRHWQ